MRLRSIVVVSAVCASIAASLAAAPQQTAPAPADKPAVSGEQIEGGTPAYIRPETPEQRRARLGTAEDPGLNPDPEKVWYRFGHNFHIVRYDRQWAAYDQEPGRVRPRADVNFAFEIYQQNDKYVWIWEPTLEELKAVVVPQVAIEKSAKFTPPQLAYLKRVSPEFSELTPAASSKTLRFEEASTGLPKLGSWRNSAAIADMNGDGFADIVVPPARGTGTLPSIYLGDGKGNWTTWKTVWPYEIAYGSVVAADFNGDRKMDLAFGIHLAGVRVFLGDGKGRFTDASKGLDVKFPTRRIVAADVNADGQMDVVGIYEGPTPQSEFRGSKIRAFINEGRAASWKMADVAELKDLVAGDWLAAGKFNADRYPDFVSANNYFQRPETLFASTGSAKWKVVDWQDGALVPYLSIYNAVATGRFGSTRLDDAIMAFQRKWPGDVPETVPAPAADSVVGIDRISFAGKEPVRIPVMRFKGERPISGIGVADFDGDGKNDLLFTRYEPRETVLLLGDGKGGFTRASLEGITLENKSNYDLIVSDLNGDKKPDVLVMYEGEKETPMGASDGSVHVYLNRGTAPAATAAAK